MVNENVEKLRQAYGIWRESKGASVDHWMPLLAEQVDFRSLAEGHPAAAFTHRRSTPAEVRGYLAGLTAEWEMLTYDVERFVAEGDDVVMVGQTSWRNRRTGKVANTAKVDVWRFKEGKVVGFHEFFDTAQLVACAC